MSSSLSLPASSSFLIEMGSYISIHNNTEDTYQVKVGEDEAALKTVGIVLTVVGVVASVVATAGAGAGVSAALVANGVVDVFGISTAALAAITSAASAMSGFIIASDALGWAVAMVTFIADKLQKDEGFVEIKPGERKTFGKYTLSLWRQGTCRRVRPNPDNKTEVVMDVVYMRPIFSGATAGSTLEHNIQFWIDKFGHEERTTVSMSDESTRALDLEEAQKLASAQYAAVPWAKVYEEERLKEKEKTEAALLASS